MDLSILLKEGYQWIAGGLMALFWIFSADSRSKQNKKDITRHKAEIKNLDCTVKDINNSVIRMEVLYEHTKESIDKMDVKLDRLIDNKK